MDKLMIGSAQFGMNYGIANAKGQVDTQEINKILALAREKNILALDTAAAYGESEAVLGQFKLTGFKIVTKLAPMEISGAKAGEEVKKQALLSLQRLGISRCEGLLVHRAQDLLDEERGPWVYEALAELKSSATIKKIGDSVYSPLQVYELINRYSLDLIQFPLNLLDQRFLEGGLLAELKSKKVECHARSLFLQGLLLMAEEKMPAHFNEIKPLLEALRKECQEKQMTLRQALIAFVASRPEIDQCILGIDNYRQFQELVEDFSRNVPADFLAAAHYRCDNLNIINPMNWK